MKLKYNTSSLVAVIALVSLTALAPSCSSSDDSSPGTAGSGGTSSAGQGGAAAGQAGTGTGGAAAGSGGASAGSGGAAAGSGGATAGSGGATAGSGGATAGTGGLAGAADEGGATGEAGATGTEPCGGCAVVTSPLALVADQTSVQIGINATNLTGVTLTLRACVVSGDANSALQIFVQDGSAQTFAGDFGAFYKTFNNISNCSVGMQDMTLAVVSSGTFDASVVTSVTVQILPAGTTGPWVTSTIHIDSITATGDAIGPWDFTSNASALALQNGSVAGSTLTWLP
ncbi:MAG TPA: hypothetical protein VK745_01875 [Polyangiaceae bacterium]|nr:hypothetical protein [Polyangiaceae bacterium]